MSNSLHKDQITAILAAAIMANPNTTITLGDEDDPETALRKGHQQMVDVAREAAGYLIKEDAPHTELFETRNKLIATNSRLLRVQDNLIDAHKLIGDLIKYIDAHTKAQPPSGSAYYRAILWLQSNPLSTETEDES